MLLFVRVEKDCFFVVVCRSGKTVSLLFVRVEKDCFFVVVCKSDKGLFLYCL